jgi:hypothetical protein
VVKWIFASSMGRGRDKGDDERGARGAAGGRRSADSADVRWRAVAEQLSHHHARVGAHWTGHASWAARKRALSI